MNINRICSDSYYCNELWTKTIKIMISLLEGTAGINVIAIAITASLMSTFCGNEKKFWSNNYTQTINCFKATNKVTKYNYFAHLCL